MSGSEATSEVEFSASFIWYRLFVRVSLGKSSLVRDAFSEELI
jgi:hypothetical protein